MSKDDEKNRAEAQKAIGRAAAGALTTQVLAGHVPPTVAALATAASGVILPEIFRSTIARGQRRLDYFLAELRAFYGHPPARSLDDVEAQVAPEVEVDLEAEVLGALNAPETRDATLDALRAALDAVDDVAVPCIARAMRDYTSRAAKPDRFYRGALRMLAECDASDVEVLRHCVAAATEQSGPERWLVFFGLTIDGEAKPFMRRGRLSTMSPNTSLDMTNTDARRAIWLLQNNGLGNESPAHGGIGIELDRDVLDRIAHFLGVVTPSVPAPPQATRDGR